MTDSDPSPIASELALPFRADRVDAPQQYDNWRDYAFSDEPESERQQHP